VATTDVDTELLDALADRLAQAELARGAVEPLTEAHPELTPADAYGIQQRNVANRKTAGGLVRGRKVGLTSLAMQRQLGVDEPDFGALLDDMVVEDGDAIDTSELIAPKVEAEIAFVMGRELRGPGVGALDALRAVAGAVASIEVIDSRIADWRLSLVDTIADNASSARVVAAGRLVGVQELDLRTLGVVMTLNGSVVATGAGAAVLGNPARCVAWLANKLAEFDVPLREGDLVLAGALHAAAPVVQGDVVRAEFAGLGPVSVRFE